MLGAVAAVGGGVLLATRSSASPSPPGSVSYSSVQPPQCPPCGLYRTPDGRVYAVDGDAISHWIIDEVAFGNCGYNHANQHQVGFNAIAGCETGQIISEDCGTCPCTGPFGILDWCAAVPCPGCL